MYVAQICYALLICPFPLIYDLLSFIPSLILLVIFTTLFALIILRVKNVLLIILWSFGVKLKANKSRTGLFECNYNGLEYYGGNKDETAVDIYLCSEDVPLLIRASRVRSVK